MNRFGRIFSVSIFGESHGTTVGATIDGCPPGIPLCEEDLIPDLNRRKSGAKGTTPRKESDLPEIVTGVFDGHTTGAPITILFRNENTRSGDYGDLKSAPRPGHADFTAYHKYRGFADYRGGGHFSGRITLGLVAAGAVAKKILAPATVAARILEIGGCDDPDRFSEVIDRTVAARDSVGGLIECTAANLPVGLGEPFFDSAESLISHAVFSIPAVKGIEFGAGFRVCRMKGSENNDPIVGADGTTSTNHAGGINGGITNGNPIVFRVAVKPTPSISLPQQTIDLEQGTPRELTIRGRHDACIALRIPVIIEAAAAIVLADLSLFQKRWTER